jgi:transketolase
VRRALTSPTSAAHRRSLADPRPSLIACRTIIGWGAPNKQGTSATHGAALGDEEVRRRGSSSSGTASRSTFPSRSFRLARSGAAQRSEHAAWRERLAASEAGAELVRRMEGRLPEGFGIGGWFDSLAAEPQKLATRKSSELALEAINAALPETIGGSATSPVPTTPKQRPEAFDQERLFRPLHLLWHPRIRHGDGDERHGAARRRHSLWRHLPGLSDYCRPRSGWRRCSRSARSSS